MAVPNSPLDVSLRTNGPVDESSVKRRNAILLLSRSSPLRLKAVAQLCVVVTLQLMQSIAERQFTLCWAQSRCHPARIDQFNVVARTRCYLRSLAVAASATWRLPRVGELELRLSILHYDWLSHNAVFGRILRARGNATHAVRRLRVVWGRSTDARRSKQAFRGAVSRRTYDRQSPIFDYKSDLLANEHMKRVI